jgi:hypothetical protein
MLTHELITYLFEGKSHPLVPPLTEWLSSSRRFTTFVKLFQDKIRKKIRVTQDPETILDVRLELETAYRILREKALSLNYEPQLAEKVRSPDFSVTFTTSLTFMLEVTRLRTEQNVSLNSMSERTADAVCSKLGQLLPQRSNVLLIGVDSPQLTEDDLRTTMLRLQQRAEREDQAFFDRYRLRDRSDFFSQYLRLSEILVRGTNLKAGEFIAWVNPQAKHTLPGRVRTVLYRSQGS